MLPRNRDMGGEQRRFPEGDLRARSRQTSVREDEISDIVQDAYVKIAKLIHRQNLGFRARPLHHQSDPPDAGTRHLAES
jgi:hypothetical protein